MNPRDLLTGYLKKIEARLRWKAWTRGAALLAGAALAVTLLLVLITNHFAFSSPSVTLSRIVLYLSVALAAGFGLLIPLLRLNARRSAREAEQRFPHFEERLLTFAEQDPAKNDPFLQLLAADALKAAEQTEPRAVAPSGALWGLGSVAAAAAGGLLWLATAGPGFWGYGASLLWAGPPKAELSPFYDLVVQPGNKTVRKKSDLLISARTAGFTPMRVRLFAKYASGSKWEETQMRPAAGSPAFEILLAGIPEGFEYYVEAASLRSKSFKITVIDLPSVKKLRVTYEYPAWTGMKPLTEDPGGDLRAPEGTVAKLAVETDKPLRSGVIVLDNSTRIPIENGAAAVPIKKDGAYYVAALDSGEAVRLTDDYFIEARADTPPTVKIRKPGRDARVSPIEEVPVVVEAQDDFGLQEVKLHYSVNGGPQKQVSMLDAKGKPSSEGRTLLYLEDYKMAPGDLVALYATARDARNEARTDIYFIEAQPFERNYRQMQASDGQGGGEQEEQDSISKRQKEIIAATWNQIKGAGQDRVQAAENAKFLSGVQSKLRDQARSMANRTKSRALSGTNEEFKRFVQEMEKAVEVMGQASERLGAVKWQDALPPEQRALQHLLRAEAIFRDIQVAFGSRGQSGGGGSGRDLENLFDLELDTEKNQYESGMSGLSAGQRQKEIDEALQKLEQLARRQQELAEQQRKSAQNFQQRWQQEILRREAEELQRKMEQLTRGNSSQQSPSQQGQQSQQSLQGQQSQQQQQGQRGQQSQSQSQQQRQQSQENYQSPMNTQQREQLEKAIERLRQATRDMQSASGQNGNGQTEAEARRAAERLKEARDMLGGMRKEQAGNQVSDLARRAEQLAAQQQEFGNKVRGEYGDPNRQRQQGGMEAMREKAEQLAKEKEGIQRGVAGLERDLQGTARDMAGADRRAASQLRQALSELQQQEVSRKMQQNADAIRRGYGAYTVMREQTQSLAMNNLRDRLKEAQASLEKGQGGSDSKGLERALQQAEALRKQMEQLGRGQNGRQGQQQARQQGQQPGQQGQQGRQQGQQGQQGQQQGQQPGQQGQQGQQPGQQGQQGQQQGQQPGQQGQGQQPGQQGQTAGQQGQQGQRGQMGQRGSTGERGPEDRAGGNNQGGPNAMNRGDTHIPNDGGGADSSERIFREGLRELLSMRESVRDQAEVEQDVQELIREMSRLDPRRFPGNPELVERLRGQILGQLEQIELQLRRKLDDKEGGSNARAGASERVPPGYADSVAEYFRKLSKQ